MHCKPKCTALQSYVCKQSVTDANSVLRSVINASISASLRLLELFLIVSLTNSRNIKKRKMGTECCDSCIALWPTVWQLGVWVTEVSISQKRILTDPTCIWHPSWGISLRSLRYGDSVDNTVEENSCIFSLIRMRWLLSARACRQ